jgi:hypothetical protein
MLDLIWLIGKLDREGHIHASETERLLSVTRDRETVPEPVAHDQAKGS